MAKNTNYQKIINSIEKTRKRNNNNWMDLMRLSFKYNPKEAKKIVKNIFKEDKNINKLIKKLIS